MSETKTIINDATMYYEGKLKKYGPSSQGVDWNSKESQELRFHQLLKVIENKEKKFSILDYGCGFGSLLDYMVPSYPDFRYMGFDSSKAMIEQAKAIHANPHIKWLDDDGNLEIVDFVVASGVMNVKLDYSDEIWHQYVIDILHQLNKYSQKGFAFNILTKYSDAEYMRDNLFYADPLMLFDYCKKTFSSYVTILHDYPLYEFTIIVRKEN